MTFLLDTCAIIWTAGATGMLSAAAKAALMNPRGKFYVSAASSGEIACAQESKRLELPTHWKPWFRKTLEINGWECLPVTLEIMEEAYSLPEPFHPDPADRIMVATARVHGLVLLTGDRKILEYPHVKATW